LILILISIYVCLWGCEDKDEHSFGTELRGFYRLGTLVEFLVLVLNYCLVQVGIGIPNSTSLQFANCKKQDNNVVLCLK